LANGTYTVTPTQTFDGFTLTKGDVNRESHARKHSERTISAHVNSTNREIRYVLVV
jgi:hypothetical protein